MSRFIRGSLNLNDLIYKEDEIKDFEIEDLIKLLNIQNDKIQKIKKKNLYINKIILKKNKIYEFEKNLKNIQNLDEDKVKEELRKRFIYCDLCENYITKKYFKKHCKSKTHISKLIKEEELIKKEDNEKESVFDFINN